MYIYAICIIFNSFSIRFNNLYPAIKYTLEKANVIVHNSESCRVISFYVSVILHPERITETEIYYKDTNVHDYFPYASVHSYHS